MRCTRWLRSLKGENKCILPDEAPATSTLGRARIPTRGPGSLMSASSVPTLLYLFEMMPHVSHVVLRERAQCDGFVRTNPAHHAGCGIRDAANDMRQMTVVGQPQIDQCNPWSCLIVL